MAGRGLTLINSARLCHLLLAPAWQLSHCSQVLTALITSNYGGRETPGQLGIINISMVGLVAFRGKTLCLMYRLKVGRNTLLMSMDANFLCKIKPIKIA